MKRWVALLVGVVATVTATAETIEVSFRNAQSLTGDLYVALFDSAGDFPDGEPHRAISKPLSAPEDSVVFSGVAPGTYAVAAFVDQDGDGALSSNFLGIPTEPYGFSGEAGFGLPSFEEISFDSETGTTSILIVLED